MIVDSTALPEQAVGDIVNSAFQSAGQRCSALRMLYLQEDTADIVLEMLYGAMDELVIGKPWAFSTDIGPVIDQQAKQNIEKHISRARKDGRVLKTFEVPETGHFVAPTVIKVNGIADLQEEVFGPVLHVATFDAESLDSIVDDINAKGYGLTFGLHTRIDDRVESITTRLNVGNMYINRNQIGAVVGSQPFGGEGLSGTGPKAGGPEYIRRFMQVKESSSLKTEAVSNTPTVSIEALQQAINSLPSASKTPLYAADLPGPTGESNRLSTYARGVVLCLGPTAEEASEQASIASEFGCSVLVVAPEQIEDNDTQIILGQINLADLEIIDGIDAVALWGDDSSMRSARRALAARSGAILPLIYDKVDLIERSVIERHICIDTTAAGGNASLLAASS
jgi:RHH-type proline utilization regulon transcriptional repressor/proline dehydrogenase/delta 1-pyrroline-5-carboxylate dehydrogenase